MYGGTEVGTKVVEIHKCYNFVSKIKLSNLIVNEASNDIRSGLSRNVVDL